MNLDKPARYGAQTEYVHWPKCWRCSEALNRPYPVEHFEVIGREPARKATDAYDLILNLKCSHQEARRAVLEKSANFSQHFLFGIAGGLLGATYPADGEQRVRVECPKRWGGMELKDNTFQASATEQVACSRIYAFAPAARGVLGVRYMPGPASKKHRLETGVR
jgi:hypothetical protein